jgi:hypothetical protein
MLHFFKPSLWWGIKRTEPLSNPTKSASQMALYFLYSASDQSPMGALWALVNVVHYIWNRVSFGTRLRVLPQMLSVLAVAPSAGDISLFIGCRGVKMLLF